MSSSISPSEVEAESEEAESEYEFRYEESTESLSILRVANGIYPESVGGIEVSVSKLSRNQSNEGHDVTVLLPEPTSREDSTPNFCSVQHYDLKGRLFGNPLSVYPYQYLKEHKQEFDVVHGHSHLFSGSVLAALACQKLDIPYVVTSHGFESQTAPAVVNRPYNATVGRYVFRAADAILTYTSTEVQKLQELGISADKIHHVTRGIDIDSCEPRFDKPDDPAHLLWVSRFVPGKGADIVVRAVDHLRKNGRNVEATLIGEGPQREKIDELIDKLDLSEYITIKGFMPQEELYEEYNRATLFILPSVSEGMNRTILESMASGTPVIISDLPHFHDVVEGCGQVVDSLDSRPFAEAIEDTLERDITRLAKNARQRVEGQFTWKQTFEDIRPIFREVVRNG